jgi:hypothetical protein
MISIHLGEGIYIKCDPKTFALHFVPGTAPMTLDLGVCRVHAVRHSPAAALACRKRGLPRALQSPPSNCRHVSQARKFPPGGFPFPVSARPGRNQSPRCIFAGVFNDPTAAARRRMPARTGRWGFRSACPAKARQSKGNCKPIASCAFPPQRSPEICAASPQQPRLSILVHYKSSSTERRAAARLASPHLFRAPARRPETISLATFWRQEV